MALEHESGLRANFRTILAQAQILVQICDKRASLLSLSLTSVSGRRVYALRNATGALRTTGKRRFRPVHRAVLHHNRALQRKRPGDGGNRGWSFDFIGATVAVQEHHHPQQHREIYRGLLDIRYRHRPLAPHLRSNHRKDAVAWVMIFFLKKYIILPTLPYFYNKYIIYRYYNIYFFENNLNC